jgi:monoamine oxidase
MSGSTRAGFLASPGGYDHPPKGGRRCAWPT